MMREVGLGCYGGYASSLMTDEICGLDICVSDYVIHCAIDGELTCVIGLGGGSDSEEVVRERLAETLQEWMKSSNKRMAREMVCLRLIVLKRDEEAKARWPSLYAKIKGKPLNPIQVAAIEALMAESDKIDDMHEDGSIRKFIRLNLRECYTFRLPLEECRYADEKKDIIEKIKSIRGW